MQQVYADNELGYSTDVDFERPSIEDDIESDCGKYEDNNNSNDFNSLILEGESF